MNSVKTASENYDDINKDPLLYGDLGLDGNKVSNISIVLFLSVYLYLILPRRNKKLSTEIAWVFVEYHNLLIVRGYFVLY